MIGLGIIVRELEPHTLHGIEPPPIRGDYPTAKKYAEAWRKWERTQFWTSKVTYVEPDDNPYRLRD